MAIFLSLAAGAQPGISFSSVDGKAQSLDAPTPDSLGRLIGRTFATDAEKTRAVFSWITGHIAYNAAIFKPRAAARLYRPDPDPLDTAAVWPSGDEMTARRVMRKRTAVCDGYARLFKVLCQYAGVEAVVIQGYGRGIGSDKFRTNHTWNAVRIDSAWHLLDATWASGYINFADDFVARKNDFYYLTPPAQFIADHFPDDLRWTLLPHPPAMAEFRRTPFRNKNFYRYGIADYFPERGFLEVAACDTLRFTLQLKDVEKARQTGSDPFVDTAAFAAWPHSSFLRPEKETAARVTYVYAVEPGVEWVHLLYKNDVVLHYRIKQTEATTRNEKTPAATPVSAR